MSATNPRDTPAGRALVAAVRARVAATGELCCFYGLPGYDKCPGHIDLTLHPSDRWAFTTQHVERIMDGGNPLPHPDQTPAAHRSCNSTDGLRALNTRRGRPSSHDVTNTGYRGRSERTSESW